MTETYPPGRARALVARALVEMAKPNSVGHRLSDDDLAQSYFNALLEAESRGWADAQAEIDHLRDRVAELEADAEQPPPDIGLDEPITEDWLKESGFRWAQHDRQNTKHWLLWLGDAVREREGFNLTSYEDIGVEVTQGAMDQKWFCWFRSDAGGLYGRFLHVRHMRLRLELVRLVEAVTGYPWTPEFHVGGSARGPIGYKNMLDYARRKDVELLVEPNRAWHDIERDPYRAGATAQTGGQESGEDSLMIFVERDETAGASTPRFAKDGTMKFVTMLFAAALMSTPAYAVGGGGHAPSGTSASGHVPGSHPGKDADGDGDGVHGSPDSDGGPHGHPGKGHPPGPQGGGSNNF